MACAGSSAHITRGDALPFMRLSHRRTPRVLPMTCPAIPHGSMKGGPSGLTPLRTCTDMRHPGVMGPLFRLVACLCPYPLPTAGGGLGAVPPSGAQHLHTHWYQSRRPPLWVATVSQ